VLFDLVAGETPPAVKIDDYRGLLYAESLGGQPGAGGRLLTVWRDEPAYTAAAAQFQAGTSLAAPTWWGYHRGTFARTKWLWQRSSWAWFVAILTSAAAILGNLEKVRDAPGWLIGPPSFEVTNVRQPANVLSGQTFTLDAKVHNTRRTAGTCDFSFEQVVTDNPSGLALDPVPDQSVTAVKEGSEAKVTVSGRGLAPGTYQVRLKGKAAAGWLYAREVPFEQPVATVRVWPVPSISGGEVESVSPSGTVCRARFELAPGHITLVSPS
jgi:hypothetical protein